MPLRSFDVVPDPRTLFLPANQARPPPSLAAGPCLLTLRWTSPGRIPLAGVWQQLHAADLDVLVAPWIVDPTTICTVVRLAGPANILELLDRIHLPLKAIGFPVADFSCKPLTDSDVFGYAAATIGRELVSAVAPLVENWLASRQGRP